MPLYASDDLHDLAASHGCQVVHRGHAITLHHPDHGPLCSIRPEASLEEIERSIRAELGIRQASAAGSGDGLITIHFGGQR